MAGKGTENLFNSTEKLQIFVIETEMWSLQTKNFALTELIRHKNSIKYALFTQVKRRKYLLVHITTRHISINYVVR